MDINYYLAREQVERFRADISACDGARRAHAGLAEYYRRVLDHHRNAASRLSSNGHQPAFAAG